MLPPDITAATPNVLKWEKGGEIIPKIVGVNKEARTMLLGDKDGLPPAQRDALLRAEARTAHNTGLKLNIAVNYGSRAEIVRAARLLAQDVAAGVLAPQDIDEAALESRLYTAGDPPVDLLIRTSGEMRQSNFLLWQCAYAEFVFPTVLWPDFDLAAYHACIAAYQGRSRRFGGRAEV